MGKTSDSRSSTTVYGLSQAKLNSDRKARMHSDERAQALLTPETVRKYLAVGLCPYCGEGPFHNIAGHTTRLHGAGKKDLCDAAEITYSTSITSPALNEKLSARSQELSTKNIPMMQAARAKKYAKEKGKRNLSKKARAMNAEKLEVARADFRKRHPLSEERKDILGAANRERSKRLHQTIIKTVTDHPDLSYQEIAGLIGVAPATITRHMRAEGVNGARRLAATPVGRARYAKNNPGAAFAKSAEKKREQERQQWLATDQSWVALLTMAEQTGRNQKAMVARLKAIGVTVPDGRSQSTKINRAKRRFNDKEVHRMRKLHTDGQLIKTIAEEFNTNVRTVGDIVNRRQAYTD